MWRTLSVFILVNCASNILFSQIQQVTIFMQFREGVSEEALDQMELEAAAIMQPVGVDVDWRFLHDDNNYDRVSELVVAKFHGLCEMELSLPPLQTGGALGWTHTTDGEVLPFTNVECDRIRRFIDPLVRGESWLEREQALGRAMGRVIAHELYHILTNTTRHSPDGVAKSSYTPQELVSDGLEFGSAEWNSYRAERTRTLAGNRAPHGGE